jgi:L-fuconolactonase
MHKIDSHQHFWHYQASEYGWMNDQMTAIRRDFLPVHLREAMSQAGVDGAIAVQARQTLEETRWLLELASQHDFIKGVVGWVPLIDANVAESLEQLTPDPKLRAVRHVLHDEPDAMYMLREDFNRGVRTLKAFDLAYDVLIFERHLPQTIRFVDMHPDQLFVVDHLAKPRAKLKELSPWRENIRELARRPNVFCKISGLATEAEYTNWTEDQLRPYIDIVVEAFTPARTMFGSDWPVCLVAVEYPRWVQIVNDALSRLSANEQEQIWSRTAQRAYKIPLQ